MATLIDRRTADMMIKRLQGELDQLFVKQESSKKNYALRNPKFRIGGTAGIPEELVYNAPDTGQDMTGVIDSFKTPSISTNRMAELPLFNPNRDGYLDKGYTRPPTSQNNAFGTFAQLSPVFGNFIGALRGNEDLRARDYYNPNMGRINSLMANRRVNVNPQLEQSLQAQKIGNYNAVNAGNSRGEIQGNLTAVGNEAMRNRSAIMANKENQDLGYQGQEAEMLYNLGQGMASTNFQVRDYNMAGQANARNIGRTGLTQLSQWQQLQELQKNQMSNDEVKMKALQDLLGPVAPYMKSLQAMFDLQNSVKKQG